jgi:hypothetical protein
VAYCRAVGAVDHLFVFASGAGSPDTFDTVAALLAAWGPSGGSPVRRTVLFCQAFDLDTSTLARALGSLVDAGTIGRCWGKLVYWRELVFAAGPISAFFPDTDSTSNTLVAVGLLALLIERGTTPNSLDDFAISASSEDDLALTLAANTILSIDGVRSPSRTLIVSLDGGSGFVAGHIGLDIAWDAVSAAGTHPLHRIQIAYVAPPGVLPSPGDDPVPCPVWCAQIADRVLGSSGGSCRVLLDPRDGANTPAWMDGGFNSKLPLVDADVHSTFFAATGHRFLLKGAIGAAARLGFLQDSIDGDQNTSSTGDLVFHPEGFFGISSSASPPQAGTSYPILNISPHDFIAGAAATEFFDLGNDGDITHIEFVKRQPAFFLSGETELPSAQRRYLDDKKGLVTTSYVRFAKAGLTANIGFHSNSAEAPLFELGAAGDDHLQRRRMPYRTTPMPMPVFPHAGFLDGFDPHDDLVRFETSHLGPYRRNRVLGGFARPRRRARLVAPPAALGVTPQGILAQVRADGSYAALYFGNPDSAVSRDDFSLSIVDTGTSLHPDVQQALQASQLFLVIRKPTDEAMSVVQPSVTLFARDPFKFSIRNLPPTAGPGALVADAFIVKYVKGKSVADLLKDDTQWACRRALAPDGAGGVAAWTPFPDGKPVPDELKRLLDVWQDPNWQGVLALNIPMSDAPSLIRALTPGLVGGKASFRAPYFGINALQATKEHLTANPGAAPQRPGSVFGLIQYQQPNGQNPPGPATDDKEPGGDGTSDGKRQYALVVNSLRVTFENSQIAGFDAKIFVDFNSLFWDDLGPAAGGGNTHRLELDGYYEKRGEEDVFSLVSPNPFTVAFPSSAYLKQFTITRAQLNVISDVAQKLTALIAIDGTIQLGEKITDLPLFNIKQIRLAGFGFEYNFVGDGGSFKFRFKPGGLSADIDFEPSGLSSLFSLLPLKLKGMSIALGSQLLDLKTDLGFTPIPFGGLGTAFQFGFLMDLDFGSLGSLAGDLSGLKFPVLFGWSGGQHPGFAFGVQFPTREGKGIDIGIQQFIRLQADELNLKPCYDGTPQKNLALLAIQAVRARIVLLGKAWPDADTSFAVFVPATSARKPSWAFGASSTDKSWYVGGGYRLNLPSTPATAPSDIKTVVQNFENNLSDIGGHQDICSLAQYSAAASDEWSVVARYRGELDVDVAVSDPTLYGIAVRIDPLGELDVMYRRVNDQLGLFSIEYTLPGAARTIQIGVATVRLPVFRLEIHTDGGFLADLGFPWNNDFSRSCQAEIAIFLGSGGFYFGVTSAAASDLLQFEGGYGYLPPDSAQLNALQTLRLGFAARVGIGRSFTIAILEAEASVTIFGGVEGAIAYHPGGDLFDPTIYGLKGYVGLMVDIHATVDFAIIRASAHILAFAEVGIEIRRVLAKNAAGQHRVVSLPVTVFAEIGITITVDVGIHIGCVDITIHLSFSTTWRYAETLSSFSDDGPFPSALDVRTMAVLPAGPAAGWDTAYHYWSGPRPLSLFVTVLPCMARASDLGETGGYATCAVGTALLPIHQKDNGFGDLVRFLAGWVLLPQGTDPAAIDAYSLTLGRMNDVQVLMSKADRSFWTGFSDAVLKVTAQQFDVGLSVLASGSTDSFAALPLWPGVGFAHAPLRGTSVAGIPSVVGETASGQPMAATDAAFADYCRCLVGSTIPEIRRLIEERGYVRNPDGSVQPPASLAASDIRKSLTWAELWQALFESLPPSAAAVRT